SSTWTWAGVRAHGTYPSRSSSTSATGTPPTTRPTGASSRTGRTPSGVAATTVYGLTGGLGVVPSPKSHGCCGAGPMGTRSAASYAGQTGGLASAPYGAGSPVAVKPMAVAVDVCEQRTWSP